MRRVQELAMANSFRGGLPVGMAREGFHLTVSASWGWRQPSFEGRAETCPIHSLWRAPQRCHPGGSDSWSWQLTCRWTAPSTDVAASWSSRQSGACCCRSGVLSYLNSVWLCSPMGYSLPGSPVHAISQARITGVGSHFLLQGIFPTQRSNPHLLWLLHWQADTLPLSHLGSPVVADTRTVIWFSEGAGRADQVGRASLRCRFQGQWADFTLAPEESWMMPVPTPGSTKN